MSQKSTRRARRQTNDDDSKSSTPKPTDVAEGAVVEESPSQPSQPEETSAEPSQEQTKVEQNGTEEREQEKEIVSDAGIGVMTRSKAATPQVKKVAAPQQNGHDEEEKAPNEEKGEEKATEESPEATAENEELDASCKEEMDPLIMSDEPDPELEFEESSDVESGKSSPILSRCKTRRSQTRNIPTPKTPRCEEKEDLNSTFESCSDEFSTKAEAGGDSTRLDYIDKDCSSLENNSFLQGAKDKSFGEALKCLSTRRTIRPISDDYRKRLLKSNLNKSDFGSAYPSRNSVERVSSVGVKRKNCEGDEGLRKRFKSESPGFFSRLTSPLNSIKNTFRSEIPSSTPKLTGYKDDKFLLEDDGINSQMCEVGDGERRWCSIM